MLVLSRKENSKIVLPELGITIEVLKIKGATVKIGVDAPRSVRVVRQELLDQTEKQRSNKVAKLKRHDLIQEPKQLATNQRKKRTAAKACPKTQPESVWQSQLPA